MRHVHPPVTLLVALAVAACIPGEASQEDVVPAWNAAEEAPQPDVGPPELPRPELFYPTVLGFEGVAEGQTVTAELPVRNLGGATLVLVRLSVEGPGFAVFHGGVVWPAGGDGPTDVPLTPPILLAPGEEHRFELRYTGQASGRASGKLRIYSNDPDPALENGAVVKLRVGESPKGCLTVNPHKVDFGGKLVGMMATIEVQLTVCGDVPVSIRELRLLDDAEVADVSLSHDFSLDLTGLRGAPWELTDADEPVTLDVGESATFLVRFVPDETNPKDENGKPIPDTGFVQISSNALPTSQRLELRGFGVGGGCTTAVIKVQEGDEVIPQTMLHLIGSQSYVSTGSIAKYEWSVVQPPGSASAFLPSAAAPDPIFEVNVAGAYLFRLAVWDENMQRSCVDAEYQVIVTPHQAIHVELLWHTPNDPDETDEGPEAGADLDLHLIHPDATGLDIDSDGQPDGWFDNPFDCFWFNPHPDWGSDDPAAGDDPSLDRDDTDGAGPEVVSLAVPEDGLTYRIGVHYWNHHGWGPSHATVRVYIMGVLVFQWEDVELVHLDQWEVATLDWPSGSVTPIVDSAGGPKIIPDYVTSCW